VNEATHLLATDFSDEMVEGARSRLGKMPHVEVEKADCHHLAYPDATFDTVFMGNLLHIISDPQNALIEARRVLKPTGRLIVLSCTMEGMSLINKCLMISRYLKTFGKPPSDACHLTIKNTTEMLRDNLFQIETIKLVGRQTKAVFALAKPV
jgi:ubiquinone/menaquinone biosynthesis C-methylase UbiE